MYQQEQAREGAGGNSATQSLRQEAEAAYQKKAEVLLNDENCYKFVVVCFRCSNGSCFWVLVCTLACMHVCMRALVSACVRAAGPRVCQSSPDPITFLSKEAPTPDTSAIGW